MKTRILIYCLLVSLVMIQFVGCLAAAATAYEAVTLGSLAKGALEGREKASIKAAVTPGITKEQLNQIKRVAFMLNDNGRNENLYLTGGLTEIMSDSLSIELMNNGYECIEGQKLKAILKEQGESNTGLLDLNQTLKAGKLLGVQAIITGTVRASASTSASGLISTKLTTTSKIQSATFKFISVQTGDILMMVAINYKHGKKPDKAAKSLARIIMAKLENPFGKKDKKKK